MRAAERILSYFQGEEQSKKAAGVDLNFVATIQEHHLQPKHRGVLLRNKEKTLGGFVDFSSPPDEPLPLKVACANFFGEREPAYEIQRRTVHELQHVADSTNEEIMAADRKHIEKTRARLLANLVRVLALGMGGGYASGQIPIGHEETITSVISDTISRPEGAGASLLGLLGVAITYMLTANSRDKITREAYDKSPIEIRARDSEILQSFLPQVIEFTSQSKAEYADAAQIS